MKKLITVDSLIVAFASAIGYGLGYAIPEKLGFHPLIGLLICFTVGSIPGALAGKIVFSKYVQQKKSRRILSFVGILGIFVLAYLIGLTLFQYNLFEELFVELGAEIIFPILGFVGSIAVRWYRKKKIMKKYGDGSGGYQFEDLSKKRKQDCFGENREIIGEYSSENAVKTENGVFVGKADKKVRSWLGIPYAKAPVGDLRWKAPQEPDPSDRVFEALHFGASALQATSETGPLAAQKQSENCLFLNIWAAKGKKPAAGKEVILYIHGGDYSYGGSADPINSGSAFVEKYPEVVFVSFNYRLGLFGCVDFSNIPGGDAYPDAVSLTFLDQIAALKWVRRNIAAFGGDPDKITLMGDTAGAASITLLSVCKEANTLFKKAILLSDSPEIATTDNSSALALAGLLKEEFSAESMSDLLRIPEEDLKEFSIRNYCDLSAPVCDGRLIPKDIYQAARNGEAGNIEFMIGISENETGCYTSLVGEDTLASLIDLYSENFLNRHGEEKAAEIGRILSEKEAELGAFQAKAWLINILFYSVAMLRFADCLQKSGNKVYCFHWKVKQLIEKLGSGSISLLSTLLSNSDAGAHLGTLVNSNVELIMQTLLMKFVKGEEVSLFDNELNGVNAVAWDSYPGILSVSDEKLFCSENLEGPDAEMIRKLFDIVSS